MVHNITPRLEKWKLDNTSHHTIIALLHYLGNSEIQICENHKRYNHQYLKHDFDKHK